MTYETYRWIFLGAAAAGAVFGILALILFFGFRIPSIINDLTGRTARKAIENIRRQNEQNGGSHDRPGTEKIQRSNVTDRITDSGRLVSRGASAVEAVTITEKIATQQLEAEGETELLYDSVAAVQNMPQEITETLFPMAGETEVLAPYEQEECPFAVEAEILMIHTDETISPRQPHP